MTFTIGKRAVGAAAGGGAPVLFGLSRIVIGLLFACYGLASLSGVWGLPAVEIGAWPGFFAATIQLVCGVLITLGAGSALGASSRGSRADSAVRADSAKPTLPQHATA
jgi:putative oxidoreductase